MPIGRGRKHEVFLFAALVGIGIGFGSDPAMADCPSFPPPPSVSSVSFYVDSQGSISDKSKEAEHAERLKPITDFMKYLETALDGDPKPADLECPWSLLRQWAAAGAILQPSPDTAGRVARTFISAGFGLIILKFHLRGVAITPDVGHWYSRLAAAVRHDYVNFRGNVYPFVGAANALSALISDDPEAARFADECWANELAEIQPDGTIPAELARAGRALIYHETAASGLLILLSARRALGRPDNPAQIARLKLLLDMTGNAFCDPEWLSKAANAKQEIPGAWGFRISNGFDDGVLPSSWTTCSPKNRSYIGVDTGGDTRVSVRAIQASPRRKKS